MNVEEVKNTFRLNRGGSMLKRLTTTHLGNQNAMIHGVVLYATESSTKIAPVILTLSKSFSTCGVSLSNWPIPDLPSRNPSFCRKSLSSTTGFSLFSIARAAYFDGTRMRLF